MMTKRLLETFGLILMAGSMMNCMSGGQTGPATCKDAKTAYGVSTDGPQTLYVGGDFTAVGGTARALPGRRESARGHPP